LKITYSLSIALVLPVTGGALYVSTSRVRIAAFMEAVPMNSGQLLLDLGCGDGRVLRKFGMLHIHWKSRQELPGVEIKLRYYGAMEHARASV